MLAVDAADRRAVCAADVVRQDLEAGDAVGTSLIGQQQIAVGLVGVGLLRVGIDDDEAGEEQRPRDLANPSRAVGVLDDEEVCDGVGDEGDESFEAAVLAEDRGRRVRKRQQRAVHPHTGMEHPGVLIVPVLEVPHGFPVGKEGLRHVVLRR